MPERFKRSPEHASVVARSNGVDESVRLKELFFIHFIFLLGCSTLPPKVKHPLYWIAQKDNVRFCLLGTMHEAVSLESLPEKVKDDLGQSDLIYIEASKMLMSQINDERTASFSKPIEVEPFHISDPAYKNMLFMLNSPKAKTIWVKLGIKGAENVHPMLAVQILLDLEKQGDLINSISKKHYDYLRSLSGISFHRFDQEIFDIAIETYVSRGFIPVKSLDGDETFPLLKKFYELVDKSTIESLFGGLSKSEVEKAFSDMKDIEDIFYSHDKEKIASYIKKDSSIYDDLLLKQRNDIWFKTILTAVKPDHKYFIAVGAGHFLGPSNLLDKFIADGYLVNEIKF